MWCSVQCCFNWMKISLRSWWDRRFHRNKQKPCLFLHSFDHRMIISCRPAICSCLSTKMLVFLTTRRCALLSLHTSKTILHFRYLFVFHQFYLIILIFSEGALGYSFAPKSKCNKCRCVMGYSPMGGHGRCKDEQQENLPADNSSITVWDDAMTTAAIIIIHTTANAMSLLANMMRQKQILLLCLCLCCDTTQFSIGLFLVSSACCKEK